MACKPVSKVKAMREEDITPFRNPGLPGNLRNFVMNHYKLCIALISCKMRVERLLKGKNRGNYTNTHVVLHGNERISFPNIAGRVPHVRTSVHGPKTGFFQCFHSLGNDSWVRQRSFSA